MLKFITSNKDKVAEFQNILPNVEIEQLDIDIPEIQSMDPHEIIKAKLEYASDHYKGHFLVEDVSLSLPALNGMPGPLVKWFEKTLGLEKFYELVYKFDDHSAEHKILYGLYISDQPIQYFEGITMGEIVKLAGDGDFGWGPMFKPEGSDKTYGEMESSEKIIYSPRTKALNKLKEYL